MDEEQPTGTPHGEGSEGIPIKEAAGRLGISEKALRGRIKRGTVDAYEIDTKFGKQWLVRLPEGTGVGEEPAGTPHGEGMGTPPEEPSDQAGPSADTTGEQSMGSAHETENIVR